jgi:hypothetical protein
MDPEIKRLTKKRRFLRGNLRRTKSGCLEYTGQRRGPVSGNPMICVRRNGRTTTMLLRRWIWENLENKHLPSGQFVVMTCLNGSCLSIKHMSVSRHIRPYRKNLLLSNSEIFTDETVRIIRYFQGLLPSTILSSWFGIEVFHIYRIWKRALFVEVSQPKGYAPSRTWQRKAEIASFRTPTGHYLSEKNRNIAIQDIRSSALPPHAKHRLSLYVQGMKLTDIGRRLDRSRETINDSIAIYLSRLYSQHPDREWLRLLNKKRL